MRTMLPPNLTRNHYEVKRFIAEADGRELPHWYQLTAEQKQAAERDVELFRRAIFRAEEEQDLVASFNAPAADPPPAAETPQAAAESTAVLENCGCPGCSTVRTLVDLIRQVKRLEAALGWDVDSNGNGAAVYGFKPVSLTAEQRADLEKRAKEAIAAWVAAGKPLKAPEWVPSSRLTLEYLDLKRWGLFKPPAPQAFLRDIGTL
ncbi:MULTISPECIES: hypothetical protein [Streptomyces]|uniref:Uncharacterized protein n=1 Tax=Streptomyces galilaeus TaxID=33899 RepID=A0ABW9IMC4_STRGJ